MEYNMIFQLKISLGFFYSVGFSKLSNWYAILAL